MTQTYNLRRIRRIRGTVAMLAVVAAIASWVLFGGEAEPSEWNRASEAALRSPTGFPQLVSQEPLPVMDGEMCQWMPASASTALVAALWQEQPASGVSSSVDADRAPLRIIRDSYPTYSAVAVDTNSNEVYLQDENLFGYKVFNRLDNTPASASFTEPKRMVGGFNTKLEFNCGLYVDPQTGDVYSVANDTVDTLVVFPRDARGNVFPKRKLATPHGTFGIAVDEGNQELFLTVEHDNAVVVYPKMAEGDDAPLRFLQGDSTRLADPHGIALDTKNNWLFISNHGSAHRMGDRGSVPPGWPSGTDVRASGEFFPPSISVYPLKASGDTPPLRVIEGPNTRLNWPATIYMDQERGDLYIANDADDSILVFGATDSGNVAPRRVIKGAKTGIKNPTGVFVDQKNEELWVSNMGNHSATVYSLTANGDVAPLRTIRSAPLGKLALAIGNPGAVGYDSKREEILVPN